MGWIPDLAPNYMTELPVDPKGLGIDTGYYYYSNGVDFKLLAFQTIESNCPVPASDFMYDPVRNPETLPQLGDLKFLALMLFTPPAPEIGERELWKAKPLYAPS